MADHHAEQVHDPLEPLMQTQQVWSTNIWLLVQSFEQLNPRAVAVVVDPIQSVKGKVVIDAFR